MGAEAFLGGSGLYSGEDGGGNGQAGKFAQNFGNFMGLIEAAFSQARRKLGNGHDAIWFGQVLTGFEEEIGKKGRERKIRIKFEAEDQVAQEAFIETMTGDVRPGGRIFGALGTNFCALPGQPAFLAAWAHVGSEEFLTDGTEAGMVFGQKWGVAGSAAFFRKAQITEKCSKHCLPFFWQGSLRQGDRRASDRLMIRFHAVQGLR